MCDKNPIFACFDAMFTPKSHDRPGYRSWFHFSIEYDIAHELGQQMSGPDSLIGYSIRHESEGWGFESLSGRDIFCLKNFDTFIRTPVRVSKMNVAARAQLTYQMLTLLKKYQYRQSQCSETCDSKCPALIAQ